MKLYEYQAKQIFQEYGIPIPKGKLIESFKESNQIKDIQRDLPLPWVIKPQVLAGGRGKAGLIKFVTSAEEAVEVIKFLFKSEHKGLPISKIYVEQKIDVKQEYFVSVITSRENASPMVILSSSGGMNIEEVKEKHPQKIGTAMIDISYGLLDYQIRELVFGLRTEKNHVKSLVEVVRQLYKIYSDKDGELVEINPLFFDVNNNVIAGDGRLNIDNNAIFRQTEIKALEEPTVESKAAAERLIYVKLKGNIGIISSGAGMTMAVMDQIEYAGGKPANFMDAGPAMLSDGPKRGIELIMAQSKVDVILITTFTGGQSEIMARNITIALETIPSLNIPVVVRLQGRNEKEARRILSNCTYENLKLANSFDEAVDLAAKYGGR